MAQETTIKLSADISGLKKGIQDANRQIKLARAEFKAASTGMEDWSKSSAGIEAKLSSLKTVLGNQKTILSAYEAQLEQIVKEEGENSKGADEMRIKIENQKAIINQTASEIQSYNGKLNELEKEQAESARQAELQNSAMGKLKATINSQESDLQALKTKYQALVLEQGEGSKEAKELAAEIQKLSNELNENKGKMEAAKQAADKLDNSLDDAGDSADGATGGLSTFKVALGNLAANVISNAIQKLKDLAVETVNVGKSFDSAMSKVSAVSGSTGDDLEKLRKKAKEMGSTTQFTASEAAEAFNYMAMAGWKTKDMLNGIDGVLSLAAASGSDLATTSDIVTDALTAMGYKAKDAGKLADVMAAASSNANTNVEMMGMTFQYAAPLVGAMGYNMEDTAVAIGLMANAGIKGTKSGTALRAILSRLAAPPKAADMAMEKLGLSLTDSEGRMKSLDEVMQDLTVAFADLSEEEQARYAKDLAGQNAMSGLLAIVNAAPKDYKKLTKAVRESDGAAADMADTMLDNLGGDMTKLQSHVEGVQIALYEKLEPALRSGIEVLNKLADAVQFLIDHSTEVQAFLTALVTGVGTYLAYTTALTVMTEGWMALAVVQKAVAAGQAVLNAVMAANPIGLIVAAIAALVAAFVVLWKNNEEFREFWINLWDNLKEKVEPVIETIKIGFQLAWKKVKEIWAKAKPYFEAIWEGIKKVFKVVAPILLSYWKAAWTAIKAVWSVVVAYFKNIWTQIKNIFALVESVLKGDWEGAWKAIKNIVGGWVDYFKTIWKGIKEVFSGVGDFFKTVWEKVTSNFKSAGIKIGEAISGAVKAAINGVLNMAVERLNFFVKMLNGAIGVINKIPGVKISKLEEFEAPQLARGGVLRRGQVGILEGTGAEAVVPLENNKRWISATAKALKGAMASEGLTAGSGVTNNYTFNQTNNSPKALSRLEIYRQTRNQLNFARGV